MPRQCHVQTYGTSLSFTEPLLDFIPAVQVQLPSLPPYVPENGWLKAQALTYTGCAHVRHPCRAGVGDGGGLPLQGQTLQPGLLHDA